MLGGWPETEPAEYRFYPCRKTLYKNSSKLLSPKFNNFIPILFKLGTMEADYFNKMIKRMMKVDPSNKTLKAIEDYRKKKPSLDYYSILDSLGLKVGVEFIVQPVFSEKTGGIAWYIPSLKIHPNKSKTGKVESEELTEFKSMKKAHEYMAKEYVYRLMNIDNFEDFVK